MDYPKDFFVRLEEENFLDGRITVNWSKQGFSVEVALVQKESRKIHKHIDTMYYFLEEREAIDRGVQRLARFINELKVSSQN